MNTTTTTTKPVVKIETGLRAFMTRHAGSRDWRVVLRIDWETGQIDVRRCHNSEGSSMRTYKRFQSEWTLSSRLTNKAIREMLADLADDIQIVLSGWSRDLDASHSNIVGRFTDAAQVSRRAIADRIDIINEEIDGGYDTYGRGGRA